MRRVTRDGGVVTACVWDHAGAQGPLSPLWEAARELDPEVADESRLVGSREGDLAGLFEAAGLREVEETVLSVSVQHPSFEEWWEPFTLVSARRGPTSPGSTRRPGRNSANAAAPSFPARRSCSPRGPGRLAASCDDGEHRRQREGSIAEADRVVSRHSHMGGAACPGGHGVGLLL